MADLGRPTKYKVEYAKQAGKLCELGATDVQLADFFQVSINTIGNWKVQHKTFLGALKKGKEEADSTVEDRLYQKATGYTFEAVKIFMPAGATEPVYAAYTEHVPPSDTAMIFWLKNRKPAEWRDRVEQHHSGSIGLKDVYGEIDGTTRGHLPAEESNKRLH